MQINNLQKSYEKPEFDTAVILDFTSTSSQKFFVNRLDTIMRPLGPFGLKDLFQKYEIPATVINYANSWYPHELVSYVDIWVKKTRGTKLLILCSSLFGEYLSDSRQVDAIQLLVKSFDAKLILGGPADLTFGKGVPGCDTYAIFKGRSKHLLEYWCKGFDIPAKFVQKMEPIPVYEDTSKVVVEDTVVPSLYPDYCLTSKDTLMFETRLGCKFNCSFCSYEFRDAKEVSDSTEESLFDFFNTANSMYGVTQFGCADDTFNEDEQKVMTLRSAISRLNFKPRIAGFNRLDIMMAKPHYMAIFNEMGFHGLFFGIETLHPEAGYLIKKNNNKEKMFKFLEETRIKYPDFNITGSFIIGLPKEPKEHILETMKTIREKRYFDNVLVTALTDRSAYESLESDIFSRPEEYGITVIERPEGKFNDWSHEHMHYRQAVMLATQLIEKNSRAGLGQSNPWSWVANQSFETNEDIYNHIIKYKQLKIDYVTGL